MPSYVIRSLEFGYNDEFQYVLMPGGLQGVYHDETEAKQQWQTLEIRALREQDLGDIEQFSPCAYFSSENRIQFNNYIKNIIGESILVEEDDGVYAEMETYLPEVLTDEQVLKAGEISGMKFYTLAIFEDQPVFYAIWIFNKQEYLHELESEMIYYFDSYQQALDASKEEIHSILADLEIEGSLEELSNQPDVLESFIKNNSEIEYTDNVLSIQYLDDEDAIAFNALLKNPIFEIHSLDLKQIENL